MNISTIKFFVGSFLNSTGFSAVQEIHCSHGTDSSSYGPLNPVHGFTVYYPASHLISAYHLIFCLPDDFCTQFTFSPSK